MRSNEVRSVDVHGISGSGLVVDMYGTIGCNKDSYITSIAGDGCTTSDERVSGPPCFLSGFNRGS